MDIVTQGIVGAIASQSIASHQHVRRAWIIGFLAGLPADADIFIRSSSDPLLTLEFHRQFTHSLLFIPVGGILCGLMLWLFFRRHLTLAKTVLLSTVAYATSGLLDACTSYGTQLLWPFSEARIAWSIISVFDPLFSLTLLVLLVFGYRRVSPKFARAGLLFALLYFSFGIYQHQHAEKVAYRVATLQGHVVTRMVVKPTMGNLLLWRAVYQSMDRFYIHAIRISPFSVPQYREGDTLTAWRFDDIPVDMTFESVAYGDMLRFTRFSEGFVVLHPHLPNALGDARYALLPHRGDPLWGIVWDPQKPDQHVHFKNWRQITPDTMQGFLALLMGSDSGLKPAPM